MLFNSPVFAAFFVIVLAGYYALRPARLRILWILAASYVFYGWLSPLYPALLAYATLVSYVAARAMASSRRKKAWLALAVVNGIVMLGAAKYGAFLAANLNGLLEILGIEATVKAPGRLFPVGISFYTMLIIGYVMDVYRGKVPAEKDVVRYATFTAFFPYLLAGPIERAGTMLPQLVRLPKFRAVNISEGLSLFVVGLFKKVALADFLAIYVDRVYGSPAGAAGLTLLVATYAFAWQIYFDFSGYTDLARGVAKMMGFDLSLNFNNPYLADGLGDFWRRWHISLSSWIRDYIYFPLAGRTIAPTVRSYAAMIAAMVLAGLWHGAAWTFVIWGAIHGIGRAFTRELEVSSFYKHRIPKPVKQFFVFHLICLTWIFFRAATFPDALAVLKGILSFTVSDPRFPLVGILFIGLVWGYQFLFKSKRRRILDHSAVRVGLMLAMMLYLVFFSTPGYEKFYYFRF
ncbi:MAG TPA: MBOAT family O-acyltransferase [Candidatus Aminicenantes bacterium]|nr:MBOAT family O-acyltransferase [Candidatus Aminicenantes bacterium]HRY65834.1 MBOAT family O-acyltransferase [Candidatus Aminicenantes bacterium]HRZ72840.1 MBOAT family O-acyltransferase [Candidatus Aminicenantes bacterium]